MSPPATQGPNALGEQIVSLVASGRARSRAELASALDLAASTVSLRVQELLDAAILTEGGEGPSRGGRRPRLLEFNPGGGVVLAADLGGSHCRLGIVDLTGRLLHSTTVLIPIADGPEAALGDLAKRFSKLLANTGSATTLRGIAVALPGPVDVERGIVQLPSRMPGWNEFRVADWLSQHFGVPAIIDNDANLMALGEHYAHPTPIAHSVTIKASTAIGSGIVAAGALHRGATGDAGDITHAAVHQAEGIACSCGNTGCLETIASGAALVRQLRDQGVDVSSTADIVGLTLDSHPLATTAVRTAGMHLGAVLCTVVNFFNPDAVFLGGTLSRLEPFVASVRSQLYQGCHPLVTEKLLIARGSLGLDAGIKGAAQLILGDLLADPAFFTGAAKTPSVG